MSAQKWMGLGVGLGLFVAIVAGVMAVHSSREPKVIIGANDEVYYYRRASKEDAQALGDALRNTGFFNGRGTSVLLWRGGGEPTVVSFVVNDGAWDHPNAITNFTEIARRIANSVGGFPLQVHLVDAHRVIRRQMRVGKTILGQDIMYYFGAASEADARTLGEALQSAGYFAGRGVTVALLKGEGTIISFVVQEGAWNEPGVVPTLDRLVRQVAAAAGGLPIRLRLLNRDMEIKKEVDVR